jgi:hypothetical protein
MVEVVELLQNAGLGLVLLAVLVFGVVPGLVLRMLVLIYPKDDPRRRDLLADLYDAPFLERPLFVGAQFETVLFEGVPHRLRTLKRRGARPPAEPETIRPVPEPLPALPTRQPVPPRECALPGCTNIVTEPRRLYCSPAHRTAARKMRHAARMDLL